jgi:predicted P-loop ATPase
VLADGRCEFIDLGGEVIGEVVDGVFRSRLPRPSPMKQTTKQVEVRKEKELIKPAKGEYLPLLQELFSPRMNVRKGELLLNGEPTSESALLALHLVVEQEQGYRFSKGDFREAILRLADTRQFDPVCEWLNTMGTGRGDVLSDSEWDDIALHCFGVEEAFAQTQLQKFLISSVARPMEPGCKVDYCLVLKGEQGSGKSSFFRTLAGEFFSDSLGDLSNPKDDLLVLNRAWMAEWSEVDQIFKGAQRAEKVKRFVSAQSDCFRPPYGRTAIEQPRRGVLCGTTNRDDWATDPTGNRRFPVIEPKAIDGEWVAANRERIFGRALVELRRGTPWWFLSAEEMEISLRAESFAPSDDDRELCWEFLQKNAGQWFAVRELAMEALRLPPEQCDKRSLLSLGRSLEALKRRGCVSERRMHYPAKASWGGPGTRSCWMLPNA